MTTYEKFQDLILDFFRLIHAEEVPEALALLNDNRDACSDRTDRETWMYYRMCLLSSLGNHEAAIDQFQEALDLDHWFPPFALEDDDEDLKFLVGNPRYEELRKISIARYEEAAAKAKPQLAVHTPTNNGGKLPLLMALHGNGSSGALDCEYWQKSTEYGYLLAMPSSSQINSIDRFVWNDFERSVPEIEQHYAALTTEYDLDVEQTIVGGFSMGATLAVWLALNQPIPIKGFIVVGLWVRDYDDFVSRLDALKDSNVRGYILLGDEDLGVLEDSTKFAEEMQQRGIPCELEVRPGLGHAFPDDFGDTLKRALHFVSQ